MTSINFQQYPASVMALVEAPVAATVTVLGL